MRQSIIDGLLADLAALARWALRYPRRAVLIAALASSVAGIANDFVYDDIPIVRDNARVAAGSIHALWLKPYWPPPFVEQLYRPLTLQLLSIEYMMGGGHEIVFRIVSSLLYALSAYLFYRIALLLFDERIALGAAVLFAVHPVHVEAVALAVGQAELAVAIICFVAVERYIVWRRRGPLCVLQWLSLGLLYAFAALFKENGFVLPGLLMAADLTVVRRTARPVPALNVLAGYGLLATVGGLLVVLRSRILPNGAFTVVNAKTVAGLGVGSRLVAMATIVPLWVQRFTWPLQLQVDYVPPRPSTFWAPGAIVGLLIAAVLLATLLVSFRRLPTLAFGLSWCIVGLAPVSNLVPTGVVLAERTLFLPSAGVLIGVAAAVTALRGRWRSGARRWLALAFAAAVVAGVMRSASRELVWNSAHLRIVRTSSS